MARIFPYLAIGFIDWDVVRTPDSEIWAENFVCLFSSGRIWVDFEILRPMYG